MVSYVLNVYVDYVLDYFTTPNQLNCELRFTGGDPGFYTQLQKFYGGVIDVPANHAMGIFSSPTDMINYYASSGVAAVITQVNNLAINNGSVDTYIAGSLEVIDDVITAGITSAINAPSGVSAGTYNYKGGTLTVNNSGYVTGATNAPSSSFSYPSRSLNTVYQNSSSNQNLMGNYAVDIACTISLTTGQSGLVILEIADNSGFTTNVQELNRCANTNTGTLTIGLNLTQTVTATLGGVVPPGKYYRLRTVNTTGTPSFTFRSSQEVLL